MNTINTYHRSIGKNLLILLILLRLKKVKSGHKGPTLKAGQ